MKDFIVKQTSDSLSIKRTPKDFLHLRLYTVFTVIGFSLIVSYVFNLQIEVTKNKTLQFFLILSIVSVIYGLLFRSNFLNKELVILKKDSYYKICDEKIKAENIKSIIIYEYISSEGGGSSIKTILIGTMLENIKLIKEVRPCDAEEISNILSRFFNLDSTSIKYTYG